MINKYFSNILEYSSVTPMEFIVDGTQANENPAACYRGFGCVSANNSSRLLLDYKVEHPQAYEQIMRLLFEKDYGVCISHVKIELGADVNSSSGTEPCTKRSANEPADVTRGAGFQFAADAKAINPDITVDFLRWGEPKWVTDAFTISQQHGLNARYRWYKETLDAAYTVYGLKFDYISADQNETDNPDEAWILYLRYRLDHETNAPYDYSKIKIIASDEVGTRNIAEQMVDNSSLRNAVDVIGLHYTTYGDSYTNLLNEAYGKEIWYSEGISPCNMPELTVQADESGLIGKNGAIDVANRIINSYYNGKMVMYEFQPAVAAYYEGSCYAPKQLIRAWEPWSGHFVLDIGFWMAMHFSRFSNKGWMYINGACFGDGDEDHTITNTTHNFMTLISPDRTELSMFFTNESDTVRVYSVTMKDLGFEPTSFATVITKGPNGKQPYDSNWFQKGKNIKAVRNRKDVFQIKVPPRSIMTVTTLDTDWVQGVNTFPSVQPPMSSRLSLPYHEDLQYSDLEIRIRGCAPRYMTDQGGAFELVSMDDGYAICQKITPKNVPTNWRFRGTPLPLTTFGDDKWHSYSVEAEIKLANMEEHNYAGIGLRYNSAVTCEFSSQCGYSGRIYGDGSWKLMDMENVAAEGIIQHIDPTQWNCVKLIVIGNSIFFFINGNLLTKYSPQIMVNSGRASLCSDYAWNMFRHIHIDPIAIQPFYVRRVDCFGDGILYNENWEIHAEENYLFYHRTSMKAKIGAEFSCVFEGTGIAIIGTAKNAEFTVLIDGHTYYENFFVAESLPRQACVVIDQLPEGTHKMQVFLTAGAFQLDVLEIPEQYEKMTDTLTIPNAIRNAISAKKHKSLMQPSRTKSYTMDAEAMLWHIAHPFDDPPHQNVTTDSTITTNEEANLDNTTANDSTSPSTDNASQPIENNHTNESPNVIQSQPETDNFNIMDEKTTNTIVDKKEKTLSATFDAETTKSMEEITQIFNQNLDHNATASDVEMNLSLDEMQHMLRTKPSSEGENSENHDDNSSASESL